MDDLRSQLLKAGLVTEDQIKDADSNRRKQRSKKKPKASRNELAEDQQRRQRELDELREQDRERQRRAHEERERRRQAQVDAERRAREIAETARRIIQDAGVRPSSDAGLTYRFVEGGHTVKSVAVSEDQQQRLSRGALGIAKPHATLEQYVLLPRRAALELRDVAPDKLVLLHEEDESEDEFDGLMW